MSTQMNLLQRLFAPPADPRETYRSLYAAIVSTGRDPAWYHAGAPDTLDGRFDMIAAVLAHVLMRMESAVNGRAAGVHLVELFVDDMDPQLRQLGIGDLVVGKQVGKMMSALGGRIAAYREACADPAGLADPLRRNLWRGTPTDDAVVDRVAHMLSAFALDLAAATDDELVEGKVPAVRA